jgi:hypothetical protein
MLVSTNDAKTAQHVLSSLALHDLGAVKRLSIQKPIDDIVELVNAFVNISDVFISYDITMDELMHFVALLKDTPSLMEISATVNDVCVNAHRLNKWVVEEDVLPGLVSDSDEPDLYTDSD